MSGLDIGRIQELRAENPGAVLRAAEERTRRSLRSTDGGLLLIAADHPARGHMAVGANPSAMGDRFELLDRLCTALARPGVDGVLGTADILEDLLLLGALDDKIVIGSMNRGGLRGSVFELDDRFTGYDAGTLREMRFDGGKMLVRIDLSDSATVVTLERCALSVSDLAARDLLAMVEPFIAARNNGNLVNDLRPEAVIRSIAIAGALGATSRCTWLKLPVVDDMEAVLRSTTLPVVLLGGEVSDDPDELYDGWRRALPLPGVRGLVVGRSLLYPSDGDVVAAVDTAAGLVHSALGKVV
jgi:hypothetical protein